MSYFSDHYEPDPFEDHKEPEDEYEPNYPFNDIEPPEAEGAIGYDNPPAAGQTKIPVFEFVTETEKAILVKIPNRLYPHSKIPEVNAWFPLSQITQIVKTPLTILGKSTGGYIIVAEWLAKKNGF